MRWGFFARKKVEKVKMQISGGSYWLRNATAVLAKDKSGHAEMLGYLLCIPCAEDVIRMKGPFLSVLTFFYNYFSKQDLSMARLIPFRKIIIINFT